MCSHCPQGFYTRTGYTSWPISWSMRGSPLWIPKLGSSLRKYDVLGCREPTLHLLLFQRALSQGDTFSCGPLLPSPSTFHDPPECHLPIYKLIIYQKRCSHLLTEQNLNAFVWFFQVLSLGPAPLLSSYHSTKSICGFFGPKVSAHLGSGIIFL